MLKAAGRGAIDPFVVMDVMREANALERAGASIIHMEVGQPADPAPRRVLATAAGALAGDALGYTNALGIDPLRERIARYYRETHGIDLPSRRIAVTTGSSAGFILAFTAAFEAGDRVAMAVPGYPAYRNILKALGIHCVGIPARADQNWRLDVAALESLDGPIDGLILASPANPTGVMTSAQDLAAISAWCEHRGVRLISDEIYHGISFGGPAATAAAVSPNAVVINSFSKYFGMTGWRIGWMVMPEDLCRPMECLQQNMFISTPTLSQLAAVVAFDCHAELDERVARYASNRAVLLAGLPEAGFTKLAPADGAFYLYADVSEMTDNSPDFCRRILAETGVAVTPGIDFDPEQGHTAIRFSFAGSTAQMELAVERLKAWRR